MWKAILDGTKSSVNLLGGRDWKLAMVSPPRLLEAKGISKSPRNPQDYAPITYHTKWFPPVFPTGNYKWCFLFYKLPCQFATIKVVFIPEWKLSPSFVTCSFKPWIGYVWFVHKQTETKSIRCFSSPPTAIPSKKLEFPSAHCTLSFSIFLSACPPEN